MLSSVITCKQAKLVQAFSNHTVMNFNIKHVDFRCVAASLSMTRSDLEMNLLGRLTAVFGVFQL